MARTVPRTASKSSGQLITGALWNAGPYAMSQFALSPPVFRAYSNTNVSVPTGVWITANYNVVDMDSENGFSSPYTYVVQVPGWYLVEGYYAWSNTSATTARYETAIAKNGTIIPGSSQFSLMFANDLESLAAATTVQCAVGDQIQLWGRQNTGATITEFAGTDLCPALNLFWIHS